MTLDHNDFLRLSRISESLRRSDPELARKLAAPMARHPSQWIIMSYATLSVCAPLVLVGLLINDATTSLVGGFGLMVIYPFLLIMETNVRRKH